jgi:hypothetical protein
VSSVATEASITNCRPVGNAALCSVFGILMRLTQETGRQRVRAGERYFREHVFATRFSNCCLSSTYQDTAIAERLSSRESRRIDSGSTSSLRITLSAA